MTHNDFLTSIKRLFKDQKLGVLATAGDPYPYTSLMTFASTEDLKYIIFGTFRSTTKYSNMKKNVCVSLLIDSSLNQKQDFSDAVAVTVFGKVAEAVPEREAVYRELLLAKNPEIVDFLNEDDCALMVLSVDKYMYVDRFQNVQELKM